MLKVIMLILITACGLEPKERIVEVPVPAQPQPRQPTIPAPSQTSNIDFDSQVQPILQANCALSGCHANAAYLQSEQGFLNSNGPRRVLNGTMPPSYSPQFGKWTQEDKETILTWFDENF